MNPAPPPTLNRRGFWSRYPGLWLVRLRQLIFSSLGVVCGMWFPCSGLATLAQTEIPGATAPASPLPSQHPQTVEFVLTWENGTPMDEKLVRSSIAGNLAGLRSLWWDWEAPETGWYAIDRPDEPDGSSDELPMSFVFSRSGDGTLELQSSYEAWSWYRAAWFRAAKGDRFAFAVLARPGTGRWRLRRLATQPVPPGEEAVEVPSAPGVLLTWKLRRARMGEDKDPQEDIVKLSPRDRAVFKGDGPPEAYPPGVSSSFRWSWVVPRSGIFALSDPPDSGLFLELEPGQESGPKLLGGGSLFAAHAGQRLTFSLSMQRIDHEVEVEMREIPRPSNTSPDQAIILEGVGGTVSVLHPDALGPSDLPPGTYHPDRFPLWWKFSAPTDGRFTIGRAEANTHGYGDVRQEFFTLTGRIQVLYPDLESIPETLNDKTTHPPTPANGSSVREKSCGSVPVHRASFSIGPGRESSGRP